MLIPNGSRTAFRDDPEAAYGLLSYSVTANTSEEIERAEFVVAVRRRLFGSVFFDA
jgi:hypothetical protein